MTPANRGIEDIFKGAEKIEIFGKLPTLIWAYIESAHKLIDDLKIGKEGSYATADEMGKILEILASAADHLGNQDLKSRLEVHLGVLNSLELEDSASRSDFVNSLTSALPKLEQIAGPRPESGGEETLYRKFVAEELARAEKIKTGRSADIVVSIDILEDVRSYLAKEVMVEGISSMLVIDNAGSLIVNIGSKVNLDAISLAAVAAANFAATEQIARLIGETDFVLLFYKGHAESFHFTRAGTEYIIVTIFDNSLSLGLLRLKIAEVAKVLQAKLPKREG